MNTDQDQLPLSLSVFICVHRWFHSRFSKKLPGPMAEATSLCAAPGTVGVRPHAIAPDLAESLWTLSERLTGVRFEG
jgi:hypothetical protein